MAISEQAARPTAGDGGHGRWTALVMAGERPGSRDPLAEDFDASTKALVPICGRPMIQWVVEALLAAPSVGRIVVMAQDPAPVMAALDLPAGEGRVTARVSSSGIAGSIADFATTPESRGPLFVVTADQPLLTPAIVESFLAGSGDADLAIGVVGRETMMTQYPETRRTWLRFRDEAYSGANLFAMHGERCLPALRLWSRAEADRKHAFRLFWHFGPRLAIRAITRTISFDAALDRAARKLGMTARPVRLQQAEAAIDVDKLADHRLAETILARRQHAALGRSAEGSLMAEANAATGGVGRALTPISIFDLDRTLTRRGTYTPFLIYAAAHVAPWRLALLPAMAGAMFLYKAKLLNRRQLKQLQHRLLIGRTIPRDRIDRLAAGFAERVGRTNLLGDAVAQIEREQSEGRRVIVATAANHYYLAAIARHLGVDDVVSTRSSWRGDQLLAAIEGENCYGPAKRAMVMTYLREQGLVRSELHMRFYSDHVSDLPTFEWADEPIAVNPSRGLLVEARQRGWPVLRWR